MKYLFALFLMFFLLGSCQRNDINKILKNKDAIIEKTKNSSLLKRNSVIIYKTTNSIGKINEYYFQIENSKLEYVRDSLTYESNFYDSKKKILNQNILDSVVNDYYQFLNQYNLYGFTSDFSEFGIEMKFYLNDGGVLLYVPEEKKIKNLSYKKYIMDSEIIEQHWYYSQE